MKKALIVWFSLFDGRYCTICILSNIINFTLIIYQTYLPSPMNFSDLKSFFEKNGAIKSQIIPPKLTNRTISHVQPRPPSVYTAIVKCTKKEEPVNPANANKDNDFLKELNQKLMNQSSKVKPKENVTISEGLAKVREQERFEIPIYNQRRQASPLKKAEYELNFDEILMDIAKTSVMESPVQVARMAFNPRYSLDESTLSMFASKAQELMPDLESVLNSKLEEERSQIIYKEEKKYSRQTYNFYQLKVKQERIKRVQRILRCVFKNADKVNVSSNGQDEVLSSFKSPQPKPRRRIFLTMLEKNGECNTLKRQMTTLNL